MKRVIKRILISTLVSIMCLMQFQFSLSANEMVPKAQSDNLALNKPVTFSGVEGGKTGENWKYPQFVGESAVDGDSTTRWSAERIDYQWLNVDLGKVYKINEIEIDFAEETTDYELFVSVDGENYTSLNKVTTGNKGGKVNRVFPANGVEARFIRYDQQKLWQKTATSTKYSSSIFELRVQEKIESEISDSTIRVGTFNIAATRKPDLDAQRALTQENKLELLGLQEVDRFTSRNNKDMLEEFKGDVYDSSYFSKAIDVLGGEYGIGTLSLYPILDTSTTFVDTTGANEKRVFQRSVIKKGTREIAFYNTHLSYETPQIREGQFKQLKEQIEQDPVEYKIIVGDFNADQYHSEFYTFLESLDMANGYQDTWYDTYNLVDPTMKVNSVDNILISRNLKFDKIELVKTSLSDHHLLTAELSFLDDAVVSKEWLRTALLEASVVKEAAYTSASYQKVRTEIDSATAMMQADVTQAEVNVQTTKLLKTLSELEKFNLAYNKMVTFSGSENNLEKFTGDKAVDSDLLTAWSGAKTDKNQWIVVDLGEEMDISEVMIHFHAQPPNYEVLLSKNDVDYTTVFHEEDGEHGATLRKQVSFPMQKARYVKFKQNEFWKHSTNGVSYSANIMEFEIYKEFKIEAIDVANPIDVISAGDTYALKSVITPDYAGHKEVKYSSSNTAIATVSDSGVITAKAPGITTIRVEDKINASIGYSFDVNVVSGDIKVSKFTFNKDEINLTTRDKRYLEYGVYPTNAINPDLDVVWSSSNEEIATINKKGLLEAKKSGVVTVRIAAKDDPTIFGEIQVIINAESGNVDYTLMQDRWLRRIVGDDSMDMNDADVASYVKNIDDEAKTLWASMDKSAGRTYLWEKIASDTVAADYTTQFTKIKKLALAFGVEGTSLYQNKELQDDIVEAINFMVVNKKYNGTYSTGNWWDWQIGVPQPLSDTLMILRDYVDYEKLEPAVKSIEGYCKEPSKQWPNTGTTATGANRTDIGLSVLASAIIARNDVRMNLVKTQVPDVMKLVTSGDGLYKDGSLVQHSNHAYTGSYGNELLKGVGRIQSIVAGTTWEITDPRIENVYNTITNGYLPLMNRGRMMSMVNGRSISRAPGTNPFTTEFEAGSESISNIMLIAQFAPQDKKDVYVAAIKAWLNDSKGEFNFYQHSRDFDALLSAKGIMNDASITAQAPKGMNVFGSMARVVQNKENYSFGLSMYSKRIANYEFGNTENKRGWHTGDGVLYLYNNDLKQYGEGYWPTIDSYRLPGTTVDTRTLADGAAQSKTSPQTWVGGASDGTNGAAGMYLDKSNLGIGMDLKAKKSWFFLDDKVVAVGSDINGTSDASIETVIENRLIDENNKISVNGSEWNSESQQNLSKGDYIHFEGSGKGNDIGYYFFNNEELSLSKETRTGTYKDINGYFVSDKEYEKSYFKILNNHGKTVQDGTYEYMLMPGYTKEEMKEYTNTVKVIKNDKNVHAVEDTSTGVFAMNVWNATGAKVNGVSVDKEASVYTTIVDGVMTISISNPNHTAAKIKLSLDEAYKGVLSQSEKVTLNADGSFTIDTTGSAGATHQIKIELTVDKTELNDLITDVAQLVEAQYTPTSWEALQLAKDNAIAVKADADASFVEVQAAIEQLNTAKDALVVRANTTALQTLVNELDALVETNYTPASWSMLKEKIDGANVALGNANLLQSEADAIVQQLNDAKTALVARANTTVIDVALVEIGLLNEADYTVDSWTTLQTVVANAQAELLNLNLTQTEADAIAQNLALAKSKLIPVGSQLVQRTLVSSDGMVEVSGLLPLDAQLKTSKPKVDDVFKRITNAKFKETNDLVDVYDIEIVQNASAIQPLGELDVKIKLKDAQQNKDLGIVYVSTAGDIEVLNATLGDGSILFKTNHLSEYAITSKKVKETEKPTTPGGNTGSGSTSGTPKTGDQTQQAAMLGMLLASGFLLVAYKKRKRSV